MKGGRKPEVLGETILSAGRFIVMKRLAWSDADGIRRQWETADRAGDHGAVLIIPWLRPSNRLLLIRQFRPPARRQVIEFPAGMLEEGESPLEAAVRELREETGFAAGQTRLHPAAYSSPGLSAESVFTVEAEIDENALENANPQTEFDSTEAIEVILVPGSGLADFFRLEAGVGTPFDAKLAAYLIGLEAHSRG
ncbi:MAG: NUDIX hydrolase [Planctomycetota bacterium]|jgi:ADP-ribose pyrophosphatase|nr:NUDIX hydrolase [Planctomycetota bacterium]